MSDTSEETRKAMRKQVAEMLYPEPVGCIILRRCNRDRFAIHAVLESLQEDTTVTCLDTSVTYIDWMNMRVLAGVVTTNTSLVGLLMKNCHLGDDDAVVIAEALKSNATITELNMARNNVGNSGAVAIAEMLKTNTTLENINLKENVIFKKGGMAILDAFGVNTTLIKIDLIGNKFNTDGCPVRVVVMRAPNAHVRVIAAANLLGAANLPYIKKIVGPIKTYTPAKAARLEQIGEVETWHANPLAAPEVASIIVSYLDPDFKFTLGKRKRGLEPEHTS